MIFNLISNIDNNYDVAKFNAYNHVIAYGLMIELFKQGHEVNLIRDNLQRLREADNTIVISNIAMNRTRKEPEYLDALRNVTKDKLCLWLDSDIGDWGCFDYVFCVNYRYRNPNKFKPVGWAADPDIFKPEQKTPTIFVDAYMWGWYDSKYDQVYRNIQSVLKRLDLPVIQLVPEYNKGRRAYWTEIIDAFKQSSFHICTQVGGWGWTNIEAATCGALLVCNKDLHMPSTFPSDLNLAIWGIPEELETILTSAVDIEANRRVALENSWSKIVNRIMDVLT